MASASSQLPHAFYMTQHPSQSPAAAFKLPSINSISISRSNAPLSLNIDSLTNINSSISAQTDPIVLKHSPESGELVIDTTPVVNHVTPIQIDPSPPLIEAPPLKRRREVSCSQSTPATSPGATSSISSEHVASHGPTPPISPTDGLPTVPESEFLDCYEYCDDCQRYLHAPEPYMEHLVDRHLKPRRLPSHLYEELKHKYERAKLKPYSTFYPSKKRKPNSGRIPRPQNQYMIFSNYVRIPFMRYFNHVNHSEISRKISNMWKRLSDTVKLPFKEESKRCELIHKLEYPNYKYKPKQKKTAAAAAAKKDSGPVPEPPKAPERPPLPKKPELKKEVLDAPRFFDVGPPLPTEAPHMAPQALSDNFSSYSLSPAALQVDNGPKASFGFAPAAHFQPQGPPPNDVTVSIKENDYALTPAEHPLFYANTQGLGMFVEPGKQHLLKRDPILAQNAAPNLSEAGWPGQVFLNSPPLHHLPNNVCIGVPSHLLAADAAVEQLRPTLSAGPSMDGTPELLEFGEGLSGQAMEQEHGREAQLDSGSLPTYPLEDKNAAFEEMLDLDSFDTPYILPSM